jgi:hypothetical protein
MSMLRAYLAVIHDSFRAALASRVLYVVLAVILLVLLAIAPLHLNQQTDWQIAWRAHFPDPPRLARRLVDEGKSGSKPLVAHVWERLPADLQKQLEEIVVNEGQEPAEDDEEPGRLRHSRVYAKLADELNTLMSQRNFFDAAVFDGRRLPDEAAALTGEGVASLSEPEVRRLNRLLIATALRRDIEMPSANQLELVYGPWPFTGMLAGMSRAELARVLSSLLLFYFDKFVMSIGIFIAILVTASIIPEMLEPGSLNLLLSKPVTRWGLLLAKFVGGCAFILLCAALFFAGAWLWMGIQMGMWESAILYSIPVYLMVFAMYYSVSVLAGICFRSPILCITLAILFWAVCFAIGFGYKRLDNRFYNLSPVEVVAAGEQAMYVDMFQNNQVWDDASRRWEPLTLRARSKEDDTGLAVMSYMLRMDELPELVAAPRPVTRPPGKELLAFDAPGGPATLSGGSRSLVSLQRDKVWTARPLGPAPAGLIALLPSGSDRLLAIDRSGTVFEKPLDDAGDGSPPPADAENGPPRKPGLIGRVLQQARSSPGGFEIVSALDEPLDLIGSRSVAVNEQGVIACYARGRVVLLTRSGDDNKYRIAQQLELGQQENFRMTSWLEFRGSTIFLALGNGQFFHVNAERMVSDWNTVIDSRVAIRDLSGSPDARYCAVTFRNGQLWLYDAKDRQGSWPSGIGRQGDILATTFDEQGRLWTGDRFGALRAWDYPSTREIRAQVPAGDWLTAGFRWVIRPLYRLFPKPGEFYKVIGRLTSSGDARHNPQIDLTREPQPDNPWQPLWSGLLFMAVTLGVACWLFQRADY